MIIENVPTLKIHKLTQEQYDRELAAGNLDENAIYLTPDEEVDMSGYVTTEQFEASMDSIEIPKKVSELTNDTSVAYSASQNLTDVQKAQARTNIGAGTSNFDGNYNSLTNIPRLYTQDEVDALLANKLDKPANTSEVIVDNPDGSVDSSLQSFIYTLPSDNTIITVDGWGYPDHIWMNYYDSEGMDSGDQYYFSSYSSPLSLPADLPDEAKNSWKAGVIIKVYYNSDIITSAVATYSGGSYITDQQVDAKIEEYVNEAILGGSW